MGKKLSWRDCLGHYFIMFYGVFVELWIGVLYVKYRKCDLIAKYVVGALKINGTL